MDPYPSLLVSIVIVNIFLLFLAYRSKFVSVQQTYITITNYFFYRYLFMQLNEPDLFSEADDEGEY